MDQQGAHAFDREMGETSSCCLTLLELKEEFFVYKALRKLTVYITYVV